MVVPTPSIEENLVFDKRLSSVVPGKITGENKAYELKGIDLAMKLHYIKGLYFFTNTNNNNNNNSEEGNATTTSSSFINILELKKPMFVWLISYFMACGRIRLSSTEAGDRPSIKLNDAGIRIVEARSSKTVEEWLAMENFLSLQDHLVYDNSLGPELPFSPLVCFQVTWFKCGGISVGLSWAHVLGDAFSASEFMNMFGQYIEGHIQQPETLAHHNNPQSKYPPSNPAQEPVSVKRVDPVGNHWVLPANCKLGTQAFHLTPKQLGELHSKVHGHGKNNDIHTSQCFEVITAIMWSSIAKIRKDLDTKNVTICRSKTVERKRVVPYNGQVLGTIKVNVPVSSLDPLKLARMVIEDVIDESDAVEEVVNKEMGQFDFIVYGANLTFVDMEQSDVYGFELKGRFPRFGSLTIGGIGDNGVVTVLPGPKDKEGHDSKLIVVNLPENEIELLKDELAKEWCIE